MAAAAVPPGLTDSDILIDARNGVADAVNFLAVQHPGPGVRVSVISCMEMVVGSRNARHLTALQQFLQQVTVMPVTATISDRALALIQSCFLSHGLQWPVALIPATALERRLLLFAPHA